MKNYNFLSYIFISLFLTSCGASKLFEAPQEVYVRPGAVDSLMHGKYVQVRIDSAHSLKLKFDTGATASFIYDIQSIGGKSVLNKKNHEISDGKGAVESFSVILYQTESLDSKVSKSTHQVIGIRKKPRKPRFQCFASFLSYEGLYGLDAFSEAQNPHPVLLDYKNNRIKILTGHTVPNGYHQVHARFEDNSIYLKGVIKGKEMQFLFDTGYNGFILLSKNIFADNEQVKPEDMGKSLVTVVSHSFIPEQSLTFQDIKVSIGGLDIGETIINVNKEADMKVVGLSFIENYNWIIDFEEEKLYVKKIKSFDSDEYFENLSNIEYFAMATGGQLVIVYTKGSQYQIGDVIKSVNGKKVTDESICEIQRLLIKNRESWEKLNVVVK